LTEVFAFIGSAGYSIVEILDYRADGSVLVLAERPVHRLQQELVTTVKHLTIHIS
jgi:hypothetical protein